MTNSFLMFFIYASQAKRIFVLRSPKNHIINNFKSQAFLFIFFNLFLLYFQKIFMSVSKRLRFS